MSEKKIESLLHETRTFEPPAQFAGRAHIQSRAEYDELYARASEDPEGFWSGIAEDLHWFRKWDTVLEWDAPFAKWFVGGKPTSVTTASITMSPDLAAQSRR